MFSESEDDSLEHSVGDDGAVIRHAIFNTILLYFKDVSTVTHIKFTRPS